MTALKDAPRCCLYRANKNRSPRYARSWWTGSSCSPPLGAELTASSNWRRRHATTKTPRTTACCSAAVEERCDSSPFEWAHFSIEQRSRLLTALDSCAQRAQASSLRHACRSYVTSAILHSVRLKSHREPPPSGSRLPLTTPPAESCG
jgi:hypothetical protein